MNKYRYNIAVKNIFKLEDYSKWEPHLKSQLVQCHYELHHLKYVENLEKDGILFFENVIEYPDNYTKNQINNALQIHNHNIFWQSLKVDDFENKIDLPLKEFQEIANSFFGSGWVWIVQNKNDYSISCISTENANIPDTKMYQILLTLDLWEHAYYLQYYANRKMFIEIFINHLINYEYVRKNLLK